MCSCIAALLKRQSVQGMKVETLPGGRQLTCGGYKDCSRPLRRTLKQLGRGSIEHGIVAIRTDNNALDQLAIILDVHKQASS